MLDENELRFAINSFMARKHEQFPDLELVKDKEPESDIKSTAASKLAAAGEEITLISRPKPA